MTPRNDGAAQAQLVFVNRAAGARPPKEAAEVELLRGAPLQPRAVEPSRRRFVYFTRDSPRRVY